MLSLLTPLHRTHHVADMPRANKAAAAPATVVRRTTRVTSGGAGGAAAAADTVAQAVMAAAVQHANETLIKHESTNVQHAIDQSREMARAAASADDDEAHTSDLSASEQATLAGLNKADRRKQVNRLASQRSRKRKSELISNLHVRKENLERSIVELQAEKRKLEQEVMKLDFMVAQHDRYGCKLTAH